MFADEHTHARTHAHMHARARTLKNTHTLTHPFNDPLSRTTRASRYQKGKTNLDFTEGRDSEWQWQQLGCMQVATSLQTDNLALVLNRNHFTFHLEFLLKLFAVEKTKTKMAKQ